MQIKQITYIILIIIWMLTVFLFSNQQGEKSGVTSGKVIESIMRIFAKDASETEIQKLQLPIRKLAHLTIYAIGGILTVLLLKTFNLPIAKILIYGQIFLSIYAASDEFHQYFIPRKRSKYNRCTNRFSRCICRNGNYPINLIRKEGK